MISPRAREFQPEQRPARRWFAPGAWLSVRCVSQNGDTGRLSSLRVLRQPLDGLWLRCLSTEGVQLPKLLKHPQIIPNREVLKNLFAA